jgi:hypothetical protein
MKETTKYGKPGNMLKGINTNPPREKFPFLHSRPVHYPQDGTGRDTYILKNHGGLLNSDGTSKDFKTAFKESLRGYSKDEFYLARRQNNRKNSNSPQKKEAPINTTNGRSNQNSFLSQSRQNRNTQF